MKQIKNSLKLKNLKPTYQRLKILKYLKEHKTHPSVDVIYKQLVKEIPTMSKTTVYNTLNTFIQRGLVHSIFITPLETRFDAETLPHHHFLCENCGKIIDLDIKCSYFKEGSIYGHKIKEMHGYFKGICSNCLNKKGR